MPFGSEGLSDGIGLALSGGGFRAALFRREGCSRKRFRSRASPTPVERRWKELGHVAPTNDHWIVSTPPGGAYVPHAHGWTDRPARRLVSAC